MYQSEGGVRAKVATLTTTPLFIVLAIAVSFLLSLFAAQPGTLLLYVVVLVTSWATRWNWKYFGLTRPHWPKAILQAVLFALGIFFLNDVLVQPLVELYFGRVDLSQVSGIEGNVGTYVLFIVLGWLSGGLCEEIIYRGYVLRRLAIILGDTTRAWLLSAAMAAMAFGLAHRYQGPSGMVSTAMIAFMFGLIFMFNKNNLMVLVLTHGTYNMIAITLIYLGKARIITDWVHELMK